KRMKLWRTLLGAAAIALLPLPAASAGADSASAVAIEAAVAAHDGAPFLAGIGMRLAPGWKTYWKNPGDSGIAPSFDWSASENVADIDLGWPAPRRFDDPGDVTYGYVDEVVWPLRVVPADPALPVALNVAMTYGVCSDSICVPRDATLSLTVPPAGPDARAEAAPALPRLVAALARLPQPLDDPEALAIHWREAEAPVLEIAYTGCPRPCAAPQLIIDGPEGVWFGVPDVRRAGDTLHYTVEVGALSAAALAGERLGFILAGAETAHIGWWTP
ncbi:MAG: hypothetical protein KF769_07770, partial [Parvibaculum sp.]|nr:hypothetical protein [Parvibaculum sp.]